MTDETTTAAISEHRRRTVEAAQQKWIRQLIDLSRRNTLLYFRHWKLASAELNGWDQEALQRLLAGSTVPLVELLPGNAEVARRGEPPAEASLFTELGVEDGDDQLSVAQVGLLPKLQAISRKAQENFEE